MDTARRLRDIKVQASSEELQSVAWGLSRAALRVVGLVLDISSSNNGHFRELPTWTIGLVIWIGKACHRAA